MTLSISLATRGRPELLRATIERTLPNISLHDTKLLVCCDEDDKPSIAVATDFSLDNRHVEVSIRKQEDTLGEKWNRVLGLAPADVYYIMADYAPCVTPGFDKKIVEAASVYPDGICFVMGPMATAYFSTVLAMTARTAKVLGGFFCEIFPYWFVDHEFIDLAKYTGRASYADIKVDCLKRPGTSNCREQAFWATVYDLLVSRRHALANKLIDCMGEPEYRKKALRSQFPIWDAMSAYVNNQTKMGKPEIEPAPPDERYLRTKAKALELIRPITDRMQAELQKIEAMERETACAASGRGAA